jgi:pyrroloquinoline quinone biosynthesis protein D
MSERILIAAASVPRLPRHIKLRFDAARQRRRLLVPERVLAPDGIEIESLQHCDGTAMVGASAWSRTQKHAAVLDDVERDIIGLLRELANKGAIAA